MAVSTKEEFLQKLYELKAEALRSLVEQPDKYALTAAQAANVEKIAVMAAVQRMEQTLSEWLDSYQVPCRLAMRAFMEAHR